jgi:hypothetical protein
VYVYLANKNLQENGRSKTDRVTAIEGNQIFDRKDKGFSFDLFFCKCLCLGIDPH